VELEIQSMVAESIGGVSVIVKRLDLPPRELAALAGAISLKGGVALLAVEKPHGLFWDQVTPA
jgi:hypothetical protein